MTRIDDLNGDEDAETVTITVNGRGIELDLAKRSMDKLVKALEPFWAHTTDVAYTVTRGSARASQAKSARQQQYEEQGWDPAEVRAWGEANGVAIPARGRIPGPIVEQYKRAVK